MYQRFTIDANFTIIKNMRVIAGSAKGARLTAPTGQGTRPTADRIKENIFNIIAPYVPGACFLDLFCGSGAIGIEALSRGAKSAVFVDASSEAIATVNANLDKVKFTQKSRVLKMDAFAAIKHLKEESFDVIFLDPPYSKSHLARMLNPLAKSNLLSNGGIIIAETSVDDEVIQIDGLVLKDERKYGNTRLMFYEGRDQ